MKRHRTAFAQRVLAALVAIATAIVAPGCSTYSGKKLSDASGKTVSPEGIPYTLVRPEFKMSRAAPAAGAKKPVYTLAVEYVPDPTQRYALRIDPGVFTNPAFNMQFASGGRLSSTTTTFTEQITPAINAIGSFAANVVGVLATGLLDSNSVRSQFKKALVETSCTGTSDVPRIPAETLTVAGEMIKRIDEFKDDETFAAQFHYVTERERVCLKDALTAMETSVVVTAKAKIDAFEKARVQFITDHPEDTAYANRLAAAVKTEDTKELAAIRATLTGLPAEKLDADGNIISEPEKSRDALLSLAGDAATGNSQLGAQKVLTAVVNLDPPSWRARHLLFLDREIERITRLRLQKKNLGNATAVEDHLKLLRDARALTIDAKDLYERAAALAKFLETVPEKTVDGGGKAPATSEYATARAELDAILTQIENRRARVIADATPPAPAAVVPLTDERVKRVDMTAIIASNAPGWAKSDAGIKASDYVLVLTEVK